MMTTDERDKFINEIFDVMDIGGFKRDSAQDIIIPFKPGDWIISMFGGEPLRVCMFTTDSYHTVDVNGIGHTIPAKDIYTFVPWSVDYVKDGDILTADDGFVMMAGKKDGVLMRYCCVLRGGNLSTDVCETNPEGLYPGGFNEKERLMEKIRDAGLEWDGWSRKLVTEDSSGDGRKSGWTPDDEKMMSAVNAAAAEKYSGDFLKSMAVSGWLESLKERLSR